jgi:predicted nucleic acid-binding protein
MTFAIVDTGPLYAAVDGDDADHARSVAALSNPDWTIVVPTLIVAETTYLVARNLGPRTEARFLRSLADVDVEGPSPEDWVRMAGLVERYADFPLGGADASIVALAERLDTEIVITLDRRHFGAVRPKHRRALRLVP